MRLSGLFFTAVLVVMFSLISVTKLPAQHGGGGGGGGGGGSSAGSSGGSHGGGGGGSSASSGSHSSGGSSSHGSSSSGSHGSSSHSSGSGHSSTTTSGSRSHSMHPAHGSLNQDIKATSQKRGFFSFLRHPFRKPEPRREPKIEAAAEFRHRVCLHGFCRICPVAQLPGASGCVTPRIDLHENRCAHLQDWSLGGCFVPAQFADDCSGLRAAMERQAQRMEAAQGSQRAECINGSTPECTDLTTRAQSEASLYTVLQERYRRCARSSAGTLSFSGDPSDARRFGAAIDPHTP